MFFIPGNSAFQPSYGRLTRIGSSFQPYLHSRDRSFILSDNFDVRFLKSCLCQHFGYYPSMQGRISKDGATLVGRTPEHSRRRIFFANKSSTTLYDFVWIALFRVWILIVILLRAPQEIWPGFIFWRVLRGFCWKTFLQSHTACVDSGFGTARGAAESAAGF